MSNEILISVIIPVYNAEQFIDRAVQSVLCQMDGSIELILVDDGSTDQSGAICDVYAKSNQNVQVVHKANGGLSSARNAGIAIARGVYLMFLDADDYLEAEACREISNVIRKYHPDCIDFGWRYISNGEPQPPAFHKLPKNQLLGENELKEQILPPLLNLRNDPDHFIFDFSCMKVFRRDIIQDNQIVFDEGRRIWEDRPFVVQYLNYCRSFYALDQCFYNYVDVPGSLSRKYSMDFFRIILENFRLYKRLYGDAYDFDTEYVNTHWCHSIENMIFRSLEQTENAEQIRKNILETLQDAQVVHWYAKRKPENEFEHRMSQLVISGRCSEALSRYEKKRKKERIRQVIGQLSYKVKRIVKKLLGG